MAPSYSIRIQDREDVENKLIPQKFANPLWLGEGLKDSSHYMRSRYFSRMNPSADDDPGLIGEHIRSFLVLQQKLIIDFVLFVELILIWTNDNIFDWSSLEGPANGSPVEKNIAVLTTLLLELWQKLSVLLIGPRIEKGKIMFLTAFEVMLECPLDPPIVEVDSRCVDFLTHSVPLLSSLFAVDWDKTFIEEPRLHQEEVTWFCMFLTVKLRVDPFEAPSTEKWNHVL